MSEILTNSFLAELDSNASVQCFRQMSGLWAVSLTN
jgi:hypothetical protein